MPRSPCFFALDAEFGEGLSQNFLSLFTFRSGSVFSAASACDQPGNMLDLVVNLFSITAWLSDVRTQPARNLILKCL